MLELLGMIVSAAFGAGVIWGFARQSIKQHRIDLNGLGARTRMDAKDSAARFERIEMAILLISKNDPERRKIAEFLDGGRRDG